jgi:hypothetical protein
MRLCRLNPSLKAILACSGGWVKTACYSKFLWNFNPFVLKMSDGWSMLSGNHLGGERVAVKGGDHEHSPDEALDA